MTSENNPAKGLARLTAIEHLLYQSGGRGMTLDELAECLCVSTRTVRRDLDNIEKQQIFPIWRDSIRSGILKDKYLPPIRFTLPEALNLFLATRLMLSYANRHDKNMVGIFTKLNCVMPSPFKEQVQSTLKWLRTLPDNPRLVNTLLHLADAWAQQRRVRINYRSLEAEAPSERVIEPYFIQPAVPGRSSYIIARCLKTEQMRIFKLERIESAYELDETYTIPPEFDANEYLSGAWDITVGGKIITVRLKSRTPEAARLMSETVWHSSQQIETADDGMVIMTLEVADSYEFTAWVMWWGDRVEVLEPPELRDKMIAGAESVLEIYKWKS